MNREQYQARKAAGICVVCGHAPAVPCRTKCEACAARERATMRRRYARLQKERRCISCEEKLADDWFYVCCPSCRERIRKAVARTAEKHKAAGLCVKCGRPRDDEHTVCSACRAKVNAYYWEVKRNGESKRDI